MAQDKLEPGRVCVGDCIALMNDWPANSVDLVFADPPYNIGYKYDHYDDNRPGDDYVQWTEDWITACARLLRPTGSMYILIGDEYAAETRMYLKRLEQRGKLLFRNWVIWHYTFGQRCKVKFNRSHAHLFYCVGSAALVKRRAGRGRGKGRPPANAPIRYEPRSDLVNHPPFVFNYDQVAVPSARQTTYADPRANPRGKLPDDTWYVRPQQAMQDDPFYLCGESDTWYISRLAGTFAERQAWHPCQLPEALLERIVLVSSNPRQVVFDPFVGSGTTLAVAARLKRKWIGCEFSPDYAANAVQRIEYCQRTGRTQKTTKKQKGIAPGKQKKKPEPHRSPELRYPPRSPG
jgi:site-specific DNA-methyltransferase (adenine-specific)